MESKNNDKYTEDEGMIEKEFMIIPNPENDETVDVPDEVHTTNFATLREPLLEDADLL